MGPEFSIITPTLNRKDRLLGCIQSVAAQEWPCKEHIIVDGGSTDGTPSLLRDLGARLPHLRFISEPDRGLSEAMNKGTRLAGGDILSWLGDDDRCEPGCLDAVARAFAADPGAGLVIGHIAHTRNDGSVWLVQKAAFTTRRDLIECWRHWGPDVAIGMASSYVPRPVVEAVGPFDESLRYTMDYDFWIRLTERFPVRVVDRVLGRYRHDEGTLSHDMNRAQFLERLAVSRRYWGRKTHPDYARLLASYLRYTVQRPLRKRLRNTLRAWLGGRTRAPSG